MQKTLLIITDGIGHNPSSHANAFYHAKKPAYDWMFANLPHSLLKTHGLSVGLPEGQMGNSEVGHMCIGAGRVLDQDLVRISKAFEQELIEDNPAFQSVAEHASVVHVLGLMSDGGVHSHINHLMGMALLLERMGKQVWLHLVSDGRDVLPTSALEYLALVGGICNERIHIATLSGRFYAMDRDKRFERTLKAYESIAHAKNKSDLSPEAYIAHMHARGIMDEFIEPASFGAYAGMFDGEGLIVINFRSDRVRQIVQVLGGDLDPFEGLSECGAGAPELLIATMTAYSAAFNYPVLFPKEEVKTTLAKVVSEAGLSQAHIAETEKYAHVSFFINGGLEAPFVGEERILVPSPKVTTYDLRPEMSALEVGEAVRACMRKGTDLIIVNFANGDMVGHTGNFEAAVRAVETIDAQLGAILQLAQELHYAMLLTSDHGNCEQMRDENEAMLTNHTTHEVYCFVLGQGVTHLKGGGLNNVAASVLKLLGLQIPESMDAPLF
ncbi:2,3-bisphosphoglycerate-independent phosphoglycerate mutase [Helicobacter baculiformis]|uniref:2,3-bisphosphoglycerate-independent phosphoglycerate mutase n=1 Tax=Helicobacter baculiformis TaxID=427351 RepID=A0ABV7ZGH7_9HELI|nr:2,3-bisphosphoglycerate-independent phosphoglycerate mutase [Helicobacter baculiformis]